LHFPDPFTRPGQWFKGSLHIHSTASDGERTPAEVLDWYCNQDYHVLALSDHDVLSKPQVVAEDFITLGGIEVEGVDPASGLYHLVGLGTRTVPEVPARGDLPIQEAVNRLLSAGGLVSLAHPYWSGQMSKDLLGLEGCFALEVYNGGCEVDDCKGYSNVHWDDLLAAGRRLWGLAVDDAHWRSGSKDAGLGWVWVKAPELTEAAILSALAAGFFYASTGPKIYDMSLDGGQVHVRCSPAVAVDFVGNGPYSRRISAPPGETLVEASFRPYDRQRYVRIACQDRGGCWAWSNPLFLE
jgi:hypothetical protein